MGIPQEHIDTLLQCLEEERYQDAKELIEDLLKLDMNNHTLYYLKAICCIHMNKFDEALIDLGEVAYLNANHIPSMHALAFLFLKKGDFESAVNKWITIKTVSPEDSLAKSHLSLVKEKKLVKDPLNQYNSNSFIPLDYKALKKSLSFQFSSQPIVKEPLSKPAIVPSLGDIPIIDITPAPLKKSFFHSINWKSSLIILFFIACIILSVRVILDDKKTQDVLTQKTAAFKYLLSRFPIQFSYTQEEIKKQKTIILSLIKENRYNQAQMAMNKFFFSNASKEDKDTVYSWAGMLNVPEKPTDIDFAISITDAVKNPSIYQNTYWFEKGTVSNVKNYSQYRTFEFNTPQTSININSLDLSESIDTGDHIELFGKLMMDQNQEQLTLQAYSIKILPPSDPGLF